MSQYAFGDYILDRSDTMFDEHLMKAYQSKVRPLCLCRQPGIPMYIAKTSDHGYILKRMPNSGQNHHPDCESYELPGELSGRGDVQNKAISEDQDTGLTNIKLDFSLSKLSVSRSVSPGDSKESTSAKANPSKLTIRSLLHFLYEDASLNKWSPKMEGKRSWHVIRKYLLQAAQGKVTRKLPLIESLLIPEPFFVDKKDEIVARRRLFLSKLQKQGNKQPMGILVGEVKAIEKARFGHKILIKHMPDTPLYLSDDVYKKMNKNFSVELSFFHENESIHLLTICTFVLSAAGSPQIDTISFMTVDQRWLPFDNIDELDLIDRLCSKKHHFIKGLRYNLSANDVIASLLITDNEPTAVYLVPAGAHENYYNDLNNVIEKSDLKSKVIDINKEEALCAV